MDPSKKKKKSKCTHNPSARISGRKELQREHSSSGWSQSPPHQLPGQQAADLLRVLPEAVSLCSGEGLTALLTPPQGTLRGKRSDGFHGRPQLSEDHSLKKEINKKAGEGVSCLEFLAPPAPRQWRGLETDWQ